MFLLFYVNFNFGLLKLLLGFHVSVATRFGHLWHPIYIALIYSLAFIVLVSLLKINELN